MGILYIVATPIGNLEDITLRALRILREVGLIAAEDTRRTRQLLTHFDIHTPVTSYFEHNKLAKLSAIRSALEAGDVALVSDAGTPTINDPGFELVRQMVAEGIKVCPIPGASSPIAGLSASGLATDAFTYLGYAPRKNKERKELLLAFLEHRATLVFLESPNRVRDFLEVVANVMGDRQVVIGREITKKFEEFLHGTARQLLEKLPPEPLGEMVVMISGAVAQEKQAATLEEAMEYVQALLAEGKRVKEATNEVSLKTGIDKKTLYQEAIRRKDEEG